MEDNEKLFQDYLDEIVRWNNKINLVSRNDIPHLRDRHLRDSLVAAKKIPSNVVIADIGSGNGFPVVPLAIERKDCTFHAFEVREKRCIFLETIVRKLGLTNLYIHNERVERGSGHHSHLADVLISRAFKDNIQFVETSLELLKTPGLVISYNILLEKELQKIEEKNNVKIKNVDNYVYNLYDQKKRRLSSFFIHKVD
jgi:16S rRNA (guanine527-N7)-methyltransferase